MPLIQYTPCLPKKGKIYHNTVPTLILILLSTIINNVVELKFVNPTRSGNNTKPVAELVLLKVLLGPTRAQLANLLPSPTRKVRHIQVLKVPPRKLSVGKHNNFPIALLRDLNDISEVADAAINFDLVVEEFLELTDIEDFVAGWTGSIDYELSRSIIIPQGGNWEGQKLPYA